MGLTFFPGAWKVVRCKKRLEGFSEMNIVDSCASFDVVAQLKTYELYERSFCFNFEGKKKSRSLWAHAKEKLEGK